MSEIIITELQQPQPTSFILTDTGTIYTFPPGTSGIVTIDGSLYNLSPYNSPSDDGVQQPVTLFVPFTITTTRKTPGVYITEVNSDKSPSEITADTGPTEEAADGPKVEEGIDFVESDTNIDTTMGSSTRQDDFPGETILIAPIPVIPTAQMEMVASRALEIYRFGGEALSQELLAPFYNAVTDWYTIPTQINEIKTKLFYKFSDGPFIFAETICFDDEKNSVEMLKNIDINAYDFNQANKFIYAKSDVNKWVINTASPITNDSTIVTMITSHNGENKVLKLLIFNIAIKTFTAQAASRVRAPAD